MFKAALAVSYPILRSFPAPAVFNENPPQTNRARDTLPGGKNLKPILSKRWRQKNADHRVQGGATTPHDETMTCQRPTRQDRRQAHPISLARGQARW
jgi:hypothetical protein